MTISLLEVALLNLGVLLQKSDIAFALAQNIRVAVDQAHHGGRLYPAKTAVDYQIDIVLIDFTDLDGVIQRFAFAGWDQGTAHDRLTEFE